MVDKLSKYTFKKKIEKENVDDKKYNYIRLQCNTKRY